MRSICVHCQAQCTCRRPCPCPSQLTHSSAWSSSRLAMGGGDSYHPHGHHTFKEVWSPSGGWWCDPKGWRRNTAVAMGIYLAAQYFIFSYSAENERRYNYPVRWTPGMAYAKHFPKPAEEEATQ